MNSERVASSDPSSGRAAIAVAIIEDVHDLREGLVALVGGTLGFRCSGAYRTMADYHLTPQETELLKLIVDGHFYKTAADKMGITPRTVAFHLRHVYEKLSVHSKSEAVAKALRERLI